MRKMYNFIYLINMICGFLLLFNFLFVYESISNYKELILGIAFIFYLLSDILYFRKKRLIEKIDIIITTVYIITIVAVFVFSVYYQMVVPNIFSLVYFNSLLIIPHILYIVYNVLRCYK